MATIDSLNHDGQGVAHVDGKAVFINGALPGETVRFRYFNKKKNHDTGGLLEVLSPSPDRVTPRCRHYGVCGGCGLQHLRDEAQILAKEGILRANLERIGKVTPTAWLPPLTGPCWGYRRKARLGARLVEKKGGVLVGFRERRRSYITPLQYCEVLDPGIAALLPALRDLIAGLSCPDRIPQIEVAVGDEARTLVFRHVVPLTDADRRGIAGFGAAHGVQVMLQPQGPDSITSLWPEAPRPLSYRLSEFDLTLSFTPTDFVQVNAELNRSMVHQALALLAPRPQEAVLDLFCGLGNFTLPLARRARRVVGLEAEEGLIARARGNAAANGITNAEFRCANLYDEAGEPPWGGERFDAWLLDPPRTGAMEVLKRLTPAAAPGRLLYVSCNPGTLARDAGILVQALGYRLTQAGVMDMFPQTAHVEAMALFVRGEAGP